MSAAVLGWGGIAAPGFGTEALARAAPRDGFGAVENPGRYLTMRGLRPLSRTSHLAAIAAAAAVGHPGRPGSVPERQAVVLGTQWGSLEPLAEFDREAVRDGPRLANPAAFPNVVANAHAGYLGILFDRAGPNATVCGRGAGLEALELGLDLLALGRAETVLAGGAEAPGETLLRGLARANGREPRDAGEGAGFLLLAAGPLEDRPVLARVAGCASRTALAEDEVQAARAAVVGEALGNERVATVWYSSETPGEGLVPGARIRSLQPATGDCRGAGGALGAVLAAAEAAREKHPVAALDFPPEGTQSAALFLPA